MANFWRRLWLLLLFLLCAPAFANQPELKTDIKVGIFDVPPLNFSDSLGEAQGFNPDLLRGIAREQGWTLSFVPGSWSQGLERLRRGEIDLMMSVAYSLERAQWMDYNYEPVLEVWGQVFIRPDGMINKFRDLDGSRVAVMRRDINGANFVQTAQELGVSCDIVEFDSFAEVFRAVESNLASAGVAPQHYGLRHAADFQLVPSGIQFSPFPIYFTSKKGANNLLLSQIDIHLSSWKADPQSFYYQRLAHWLGIKQSQYSALPTWLLGALAAAAAIALLLVVMSLLLKAQVKKRTLELAASNAEQQKSEQRYRNLIDSMVQPMALQEVICDAAGEPVDYRFLDVNRAFEKLLGKPAEEIVGQRVLDILPSTEKTWIETYGKVALTGEAVNFQRYSAEMDRHFDIVAYSPQPRQFAIVATDVSARVKMQAEQKRLEEQILHTQKIESLGVLAGGIAHDFNNILMAVLGHCELALRRVGKEAPVVQHLEQIKNAASKAADLANQMLAYSGRGKFVIEPHDLSEVIGEMEQMLRVSISKKAVLRYELAPHLPSVEVDVTQLRQIVLNLVINASDAIGETSGVVAITTGVMDCDQSYLSETWLDENLPAGQYVYLEVADTGCGMDSKTIERIFEPFFTTKFAGRGLGMAAVLGIVRGHQGAIKVYSEIGKGTTFKVLLPAASKPAVLFDQRQDLPLELKSGTVLLVDDDETVRSIGRSMLEELGFDVLIANDGRHALEIFQQQHQQLRFVLMDLTMPHLDGEQAFREMRRIDPQVKVIMSSGYNEQDVTQKFVGKRLAGFLKKPYQLSALQESIAAVLAD